jgi:hypothetical protein
MHINLFRVYRYIIYLCLHTVMVDIVVFAMFMHCIMINASRLYCLVGVCATHRAFWCAAVVTSLL